MPRQWWLELKYLTPAILGATVVISIYFLTTPRPAYFGGLYLDFAATIQENNWALPARIPHYTASGAIFAYPPLAFYLLAVLKVLGISGLTALLVFPPLWILAYLPVSYYLGIEFLEDRRQAGLATFIIVTSIAMLRLHLAGSGFVRAFAFLFATVSIYYAIRTFQSPSFTGTATAGVFFGLTLLTHPTTTLFAAISIIALWATVSSTRRGFIHGSLIAASGFLIATPWFWQIHRLHGLEIFLTATGSRPQFHFPRSIVSFIKTTWTPFLPVWHILGLLGGIYLAMRRRIVLPVWFVALLSLVAAPRYLMFVLAFMIPPFVFEVFLPALRPRWTQLSHQQIISLALAALFIFGIVTGGMQASSAQHPVSKADRTAMEWVTNNTPPDTTFSVLGWQTEWFPYYTSRTVTTIPWGAEWSGEFLTQRQRWARLQDCQTASCVQRETPHNPEYIYITSRQEFAGVNSSLAHSDSFKLVYQNERVVIYQLID